MDFYVSEIFYSIQGEGRLAGMPSVFVRLAGCSLRCKWCDTAYAWGQGDSEAMAAESIVAKVQNYNCRHVVVTGGEPLEAENLVYLLELLTSAGLHITLETACLEFIPVPCDLVSISPKLSNSYPDDIDVKEYSQKCLNPSAIAAYMRQYETQLKFVVSCDEDVSEIKALLEIISDRTAIDPSEIQDRVMLMPKAAGRQQYREIAPLVAELCLKYGYCFSPRLHVEYWGNTKGT